ncbi:MAG: F0F1 ATP synthase subunit epsilon [Prevotella sp.]|nr:F0F1 ATP synthase subunit epsilon [Prevotella sp.]
MNEFQCIIASSDKIFYDGPCLSLIVPAWDGEYAFMAKHQECVAAVSIGTLRVKKPDGSVVLGVCGLGLVCFEKNRAVVLVDTIERPEDIDEVQARRAKEQAEEELKEAKSQQEYNASQAALARAIYRLSARGKYVHDQKLR